MRSTLRRTSSTATSLRRSVCPGVTERESTRTFGPSTYPRSPRASRNTACRRSRVETRPLSMASTPIRGLCAGGASAASDAARILQGRGTMTPTVLSHMIVPRVGMKPTFAFPWQPNATRQARGSRATSRHLGHVTADDVAPGGAPAWTVRHPTQGGRAHRVLQCSLRRVGEACHRAANPPLASEEAGPVVRTRGVCAEGAALTLRDRGDTCRAQERRASSRPPHRLSRRSRTRWSGRSPGRRGRRAARCRSASRSASGSTSCRRLCGR